MLNTHRTLPVNSDTAMQRLFNTIRDRMSDMHNAIEEGQWMQVRRLDQQVQRLLRDSRTLGWENRYPEERAQIQAQYQAMISEIKTRLEFTQANISKRLKHRDGILAYSMMEPRP